MLLVRPSGSRRFSDAHVLPCQSLMNSSNLRCKSKFGVRVKRSASTRNDPMDFGLRPISLVARADTAPSNNPVPMRTGSNGSPPVSVGKAMKPAEGKRLANPS